MVFVWIPRQAIAVAIQYQVQATIDPEEVTCTYSNRNQQRNKDVYYDYEAHDQHLQSLPRFIDDGEESDSSANNDQCEIVTDTEDSENLLVNLNKYLNMDSTDDDEASTGEKHQQNVLEKSIGEDEFEQDDDSDDPVLSNLISSTTTPITSVSSVIQLQKPLAKATEKQTFIDPKAVATTGTTTTATIRREKYEMVWEIHALSSFITSKPEKKPETSQWAPSRGPMGASVPRDVCNMDESPLSLFGDQLRLSINDVNTSNDIEGCISNKRFATVILTIFGSDNTRVGPVLIFKGKGQASSIEKMQYANGVKVYFTPKAVSNRITMDKYMEYWMPKVNDKNPKLFISDSSNTHFDHQSIRLLRKKQIVVAIIPKGCTMYIQALDVYVFSIFKKHYYDCSEEYIEKACGRLKVKLTASKSRVLCTRLTLIAWKRTLSSIDFSKSFREIGYTWADHVTPIKLHTLPGYMYDPSDCNLTCSIEENEIDFSISSKIAKKQLKLTDFR
ncbi:unnamed protein product [Rotaria socialis]|uniref:DDE-1 domain-containing protein n=1 Tax=Rotaria socialis TaxID=392032 RepID=A0A821BQA3_9BILA|nr:unnamed protein product [Rotaria socialis]